MLGVGPVVRTSGARDEKNLCLLGTYILCVNTSLESGFFSTSINCPGLPSFVQQSKIYSMFYIETQSLEIYLTTIHS